MYDIKYLFGFKNNIDLNLLQMIYNKDKIDNFKNIWYKFNELLEFRSRHQSISYLTKKDLDNCEKYITTFGFIFFNQFNYDILNDTSSLWIVSLFDYIYNKLSVRLREKLVKIIEVNIYANHNVNPDVIISFITHPVFSDRYFIQPCLDTISLETSSLLGRLISPLNANVEFPNIDRIYNQERCIEKSSVLFNYLYQKYPDKILDFFYSILKKNEGKTRVQNQCYFVDNINTYNFLLNMTVVINYILSNITDYENSREPINLCFVPADRRITDGSNTNKLYWLVYEYYRITFYSLLQQNQNASIQMSLNPILRDNFKLYVDANNKYLHNTIYYETFYNFMFSLVDSDTFIQLDEDTISEILYYVDNLIDSSHNTLSVVCKKTLFRSISKLLLYKHIINPYITIKLIKIVYLLEKFCNIDPKIILLDNVGPFYNKLCNFYISIDKLAGLDMFSEKFFYKTNILEIILANADYKITNKQLVIIIFNDIESTLEYLITSSKQLEQTATLNMALYENYKKNSLNYLSRLKFRIIILHRLILEKNSLFNEIDVKYHLIKYYYGVLKNCFDINSSSIKISVLANDNETLIQELWNFFLENVIRPFSLTIDKVLNITDIVEMINCYYGDIDKYLKLMDRDIGTDYSETLRIILLGIHDKELPNNLPDEFLDPLLFTPIKYPMILPESKLIMDKAVIEAHLVENNYDPFNRQPLTYELLMEYNCREEQKLLCLAFIQKRDEWIKTNHCQKCSETD
jgi:hypothetical protein